MEIETVSIIIPCYNCTLYIERLFKSILFQDYKYIEIIAIDDGSNDSTLELLNSYNIEFIKKGYTYKVIHQENQGVSSTINNGLKLVSGSYLLWPDIDDWFENETTISKMVTALQTHPNYNCVRVLTNYVDEKTFEKKPITPSKIKEDLFYDFIYWNDNIWTPAGSHMIRLNALFNSLKEKNIYVSKNIGQSYQLLLPILYGNKCYTIEEYLYNILVRKGSHSRGQYSKCKSKIQRWNESSEMLKSVISSISDINNIEKKRLIKFINKRYNSYNYKIALRHYNFILAIKYYIKSLS